MNQLQLAGRLAADPEVRHTPSGQKVTKLRMAVSQRVKGQESTMWWSVTLWGDSFDKIVSFLKKGSALIVTGEMLEPRIYTGKDGSPQVGLEMRADIVRFSPFGSGKSGEGETSTSSAPSYGMATAGAAAGSIQDDDLPF